MEKEDKDQLSSDEQDLLKMLAYVYLQHRKYDEALTLLKALKVLIPEDFHVCKMLSYALLQAGLFEDALLEVEYCLSLPGADSDATNLRLIKSRSLWGMGEKEAARQTWQALAEKTPEPPK